MIGFLGLNPPALLFEHAVMCEAFATLLYVLLVLAGLAMLRRDASWPSWVGFGGLLGACTLTRANVLALGVAFALAACLRHTPERAGTAPLLRRAATRLRPLLLSLGVAGVVVAPWLWRNWTAYGHPTLYNSTSRNLLMYKALHFPLDGASPTLRATSETIGSTRVDFYWLGALEGRLPSNDAEAVARRIVLEELAAHPWRHVGQIGASGAAFAGFDASFGDERSALRYWFRELVRHVPRMDTLALGAPAAATIHDWTYVPGNGDTAFTRRFGRYGDRYLWPGRAIASALLGAMLLAYLFSAARSGRTPRRLGTVLVLGAAHAGTLAMHAVILADYDRYACMFDFLSVLIAALVAEDAAAAWRLRALRQDAAAAVRRQAPSPRRSDESRAHAPA
jgi:hypothetical protein